MTKCVILAGERGTRISEESHLRPKPMMEIGARPILWHIMKGYAAYGVTEFIICLRYRGYLIKEYFANHFLHSSDVTINVALNTVSYHDSRSEPWEVTLVDTGEATLTGGRILRIRRYLDTDEPFYLTYGDGLADIDFAAQLDFHRRHGRLATMTVVRPPARFGGSMVEGDRIVAFEEKPQASTGLINGGAEGGRNEQTPREHVPQREYRAGERTGHVRRRTGGRCVGGNRRSVDQAVRVHDLHPGARESAATACGRPVIPVVAGEADHRCKLCKFKEPVIRWQPLPRRRGEWGDNDEPSRVLPDSLNALFTDAALSRSGGTARGTLSLVNQCPNDETTFVHSYQLQSPPNTTLRNAEIGRCISDE